MNPFALPFACLRCHDVRTVTRRVEAREKDLVPCPSCGTIGDEEYGRFRSNAFIKSHAAPTLCELDLTPEEFAVFKKIREEHPLASKTSVLSWLEGQRYNPAEDVEFLEEARTKFKEWRAR